MEMNGNECTKCGKTDGGCQLAVRCSWAVKEGRHGGHGTEKQLRLKARVVAPGPFTCGLAMSLFLFEEHVKHVGAGLACTQGMPRHRVGLYFYVHQGFPSLQSERLEKRQLQFTLDRPNMCFKEVNSICTHDNNYDCITLYSNYYFF